VKVPSTRKCQARDGLVTIRLFASQNLYTEEEIPLLEEWIKENDPAKMRLHFETKVLRARAFSATDLQPPFHPSQQCIF
jgi:hypothetical protein